MKENVIVFGRGAYWQNKKDSVVKKFNVVAFLDNNATEGELEEEIPVYNPQNMPAILYEKIIIMASRKYFIDMAKQLVLLGISSEQIVLGLNLLPCFDQGEELIQERHGKVIFDGTQAILQCDAGTYYFDSADSYADLIRQLSMREHNWQDFFSSIQKPISRHFGVERGHAIDRYYIEKFLIENQEYIHGKVLEIADLSYTKRFGRNITAMQALHVKNWGGAEDHIQGNLETGEGIPENVFDCLICTQTLQMIYDIHAAVRNVYKLLKPGGVALITGSGISQISMNDYNNWGEYWRFTKLSMERLLEEVFLRENIVVKPYGNVKTTMGFLYGLSQEDLMMDDFANDDEQYQLLIAAYARKEA